MALLQPNQAWFLTEKSVKLCLCGSVCQQESKLQGLWVTIIRRVIVNYDRSIVQEIHLTDVGTVSTGTRVIKSVCVCVAAFMYVL